MAGFVSCPSTAPADPEAPEADTVAGDAFYPGVSLTEARSSLRIPTAVSDIRLRDALRGGMISTRRELRKWKAGHVAAGRVRLADVDDEEVDGQSAAELLYRRAVFAYAGAELSETHHDISASGDGKGKDRTEEGILSADEFRRNATHAIRDILGTTRTTVELI
jgi:hypothetical protein